MSEETDSVVKLAFAYATALARIDELEKMLEATRTELLLFKDNSPSHQQWLKPVPGWVEGLATPPRRIEWEVHRKARGYPQYDVRCECGWKFQHPSAVVTKLAADEHKCYAKICAHGLTANMGCAVCTTEDYALPVRSSDLLPERGFTNETP